jgi:GT2 family glycosyltransferase
MDSKVAQIGKTHLGQAIVGGCPPNKVSQTTGGGKMNDIDVSVILVNYNTREMTIDAIESVLEKTKDLNFEIFVVDNCSSDGSAVAFKEKFGDRINVIESETNCGFGAGNNLAIRRARGRYVFLLNTDTLLINNAIKVLFDFMEANPAAGVSGGNLFKRDGVTPNLSSCIAFPRPFSFWYLVKKLLRRWARKNKLFNNLGFNATGVPAEVGFITGADMLIRKKVLDEVGLFDEDFFMYYEETELTKRIRSKLWKVFSVPDAKIIHFDGSQTNANSQRGKIIYTSEFLFMHKVYGEKAARRHFRHLKIINRIKRLLRPRTKSRYLVGSDLRACFESYLKIISS